MPVRDLTVLFQIIDKVSGVLDPILNKMDAIDGREVVASADMDVSGAVAGASALESSLDSLHGANEKVAGSLEKVAGSEDKEGKKAEEAGKKTKKSGEDAKYATGLYGHLQRTLDTTASKFEHLKDKLDPIKGKLLAVQAVLLGFGTAAVLSTAKTQSLVEELKGLKGEGYAAPLIEWANKGSALDYTSKSQRLTIATDLSDLDYSVEDTKKYGEEIEKFYFQKTGALKRYGIASAAELAKTLAAAEKSGNMESVRKLFSSGAVSEEKLSKEMDRLRVNYEKFAFATDEVVKKQALHNLMMKELQKTNQSFTGQAVTLEQKLDVLQGKFSGLLSGIGGKLEPVAEKVVDALIYIVDGMEAIPGHDEILLFFGTLITILTALATAAVGLAPVFSFLAGAAKLGAVASFVSGLGGVLSTLAGVVTTVAGGLAALVAGLAAIPGLPIIAAILAIVAVLALVYTKTTILQDGFATLKDYVSRALGAVYKIFSTVTGGLRGNKSDLKDLGDWVKDWLDGLIPGWLSDIFATARSYYREALKWFDKIMGWWNDFLKKIGEVYDKIKSMLGLGTGEQEITPEMQEYGVTGTTEVNGQKAIKVAYRELPTSQWGTDIEKQIKDATGGKVRLVGKEYTDFAQEHPELAKYLTKGGELSVPMDDIGDYGIPDSALPKEDSSPFALPDIPAAVGERVQEASDSYVEDSSNTYNEVKEKTGSETMGAMSSYNPVGFYKDLIFGTGEKKEEEKLPAGAVGATVDGSGAMIVHEDEELVPAKITSGAGKLASLLGAALDFMAGRSDIEREISEKMILQQQDRSSSIEKGGVVIQSMPITINPTVNLSLAQAMDLKNLDISKLIDWSRLSYEIEKAVKATFRTQEG